MARRLRAGATEGEAMSDFDPRAVEFLQINIKKAMAAEFRWGVIVGALVGFVLGIVVGTL